MGDGLPEKLYMAWRAALPDPTDVPSWGNVPSEARLAWEAVAMVAHHHAVTDAVDLMDYIQAAKRAAGDERVAGEPLAEFITRMLEDRDALRAKLNTPHVADFIEALRVEAAHQVERWGVEHDAGKRPEDWIALVTYLLGKATKAHYDGDRDKLLHHVITVAAACANWHANATGVDTRMRPGVGP